MYLNMVVVVTAQLCRAGPIASMLIVFCFVSPWRQLDRHMLIPRVTIVSDNVISKDPVAKPAKAAVSGPWTAEELDIVLVGRMVDASYDTIAIVLRAFKLPGRSNQACRLATFKRARAWKVQGFNDGNYIRDDFVSKHDDDKWTNDHYLCQWHGWIQKSGVQKDAQAWAEISNKADVVAALRWVPKPHFQPRGASQSVRVDGTLSMGMAPQPAVQECAAIQRVRTLRVPGVSAPAFSTTAESRKRARSPSPSPARKSQCARKASPSAEPSLEYGPNVGGFGEARTPLPAQPARRYTQAPIAPSAAIEFNEMARVKRVRETYTMPDWYAGSTWASRRPMYKPYTNEQGGWIATKFPEGMRAQWNIDHYMVN
jgi:hypothetical protein